ncbi:ATPase domain-containing protein [Halomarina pelagica]|uniref:ATPase domain-containing protein n=1 Tax=Halomarina pelagica TaxID=2961599 RepID=UPI0020C1F724|nr:ATPase domain-containing protein [Halomarina sp. BND7]
MTDHYSIGLEARDRVNHAIGGGLPAGHVVLIEGPDGGGKSVLGQRFAYGLACEGTPTAYVSTELSSSGFVDQMHSLSYDVVDHLLAERLLFVRADVTGERRLLARLMDDSPLWRADVLVVDGLDAILRNDPEVVAARSRGEDGRVLQSFVARLGQATAAEKTVVLTVNPEPVSERAMRPLRDAAGVYLEIETTPVGQDIRRSALVHRFAEMANPVNDTIGFSVQQGRGITIESRTVA